MSFSKLKRIHVLIIGSVLCVATGVAMFFLLIKPQREAFAAAQKRYEAAKVLGCQEAEDKAVADLALANQEKSQAEQVLNAEMRRRMPNLSFTHRDRGMLQLWNEQIKTLGPLLESYARDKNVKLLSAQFQIPAPPANPNDSIFDSDVITFPLGTVQVQGDFVSVTNNIRRWNNCRRLVLVTDAALSGASPELVAQYKLTCFIFPVAKGGPLIPMAGAAQPGQTTF